MRYLAQVLILFVALICVAETSLAQVVVVQPPTPPATTIDIAIQDGSPIKISVTENKTNIPMLLFNIDNVDSRAVRGYVIVTESDKRKHLSTTLYPSDSLRTGAQDKRGFSLFDGTRLSLMVDFVLFEDGTSWGADQFGRSRIIASYMEGRDLAESRLRSLITDADHALFLPISKGLGSVTMGEAADDRRPVDEAKSRKSGYDNVLFRLRSMKTRTADAQELARKLELMQTP